MSKQLADALRDAILCVDPTANPETFKAAQLALTQYDTLPEAYRVTWEIDTFNASTPREAAQEAWRTMRRIDSTANVFTVRGRDGTITEVDLSHE